MEEVKYITKDGRQCPTDCTVMINDKEFLIDSLEWDIVCGFHDYGKGMKESGHTKLGQEILGIIYKLGNVD